MAAQTAKKGTNDFNQAKEQGGENKLVNILVIGGYGSFGKRLVLNLTQYHDYAISIAGRSTMRGEGFCAHIKKQTGRHIGFLQLDTSRANLCAMLKKQTFDVIVNASGPYQNQWGENQYQVARACLDIHCHYIDLADAREFVSQFSASFDQQAKQADVMLVTGASTVPGLSSAVVDKYIHRFDTLTSIHVGVAPGNKTERGSGTVASILSYTGKPFSTLTDGRFRKIYGWQNVERHDFGPPLGKRWLSNCNIPDLALFPQRYPNLKTMHFKAGLELGLLHCGLWLLSGLSRRGIIQNWNRYTSTMIKLSQYFANWGSENGGMFMQIKGVAAGGKETSIEWQLIAENGAGPNVPTISAELVINRIARGEAIPGARACTGLFTVSEFFDIASRWGIYQKENVR